MPAPILRDTPGDNATSGAQRSLAYGADADPAAGSRDWPRGTRAQDPGRFPAVFLRINAPAR